MSLMTLRTKKFDSAEELCQFVNDNGISVIEQIIAHGYASYVLFYRQE